MIVVMINLTDNEKSIIEILRSLNPFEKVTIEADKAGKLNNFVVSRTRKAILTDTGIIYITA